MTNRLAIAALLLLPLALERAPAPRIQVLFRDPAPRVDVLMDGQPFTSYLYPTSFARPVLLPVRGATGATVTLDVPGAAASGDPVRASEHFGFWFGHGDVNGIDFWGAPGGDTVKAGTIVHRRLLQTISSDDRGELSVQMDWIGPDRTTVLVEDTVFVFRGSAQSRSIDRITRLAAVNSPVVFGDNPHGLVGLRIAPAFLNPRRATAMGQSPIDSPMAGGKRAPWLAIAGPPGRRQVTLAVLDHPQNHGFPGYWIVGASGVLEIKPALNPVLESGRSIVFRHRLLIRSGSLDVASIEREFRQFAQRSWTPGPGRW